MSYQTLRISNALLKQMAIQSGWVDAHWIWLIAPSAVYASMGSGNRAMICSVDSSSWKQDLPSMARGICWISQIRAWWSSAAVQIWQEEWGAQAIPLTQALWLFNRATGVHGTRTSRMITWKNVTVWGCEKAYAFPWITFYARNTGLGRIE